MLYSFALVSSLVHFIFINKTSFKTGLKRTLYVYQKSLSFYYLSLYVLFKNQSLIR